MEENVRAALKELLELVRLHQRDGRLSSALKARKGELECMATEIVDRIDVPAKDLRRTVRRLFTRQQWLPGVYGGLAGWFTSVSTSGRAIFRIFASICVAFAGAVGPLLGRPWLEHLYELMLGPIPYTLSIWVIAYPAVLSWSEELDSSRLRCGYLQLEESLLAFGTIMLGVWLSIVNASHPTWFASGLIWAGTASASMISVRPAYTHRLIDKLAREILRGGMRALEQENLSFARQQFEFVLWLKATRVREQELLAYLHVAILLEAEYLRNRGDGLAARSLLWSRGVTTGCEQSLPAIKAWSERKGVDEATLREEAGLFVEAGEMYLDTQRLKAAKRAFQTAALTAKDDETRLHACHQSIAIDGDIGQPFLHRLLDEIENKGLSAKEYVKLIASLPSELLESPSFLTELRLWVGRQAADHGVAVMESIVATSSPTERPGIYTLLADTYERGGHSSTARRIRAGIPEHEAKWVERSPSSVSRGPVPDTSDLAAELSERYQICSRLGVGSMGAVYLADDVVLERPVALKVHNPKLMTDLFVEKFRAEARVVARLDHPNIVRVFDAGQSGNWLYFVMEFVDGPNLGSLVEAEEHKPSISACVEWAVQVAEAMAYAHSQGVIHRDLKPANVLIHPGGQARVTDFGVARVVDAGLSPDMTAFSQAGLRVGTPSFMAPEQLAERCDANVLTDVYALGMTLYYAVTAQLPFEDDPLLRLDTMPPSAQTVVPIISDELDELLNHVIEPDPDRRLYGMKLFAERLRECPEFQTYIDSSSVPIDSAATAAPASSEQQA